jgi:glycosyltransferase involved in cell wall biosynthesis
MPRVSVVIPCYNLGAYLDETVASVLGQTFTDFEILVVNDGSNDPATCALLADYRRPRTRVIHIANRGVAAARNCGISEAVGEYILPLDADDRIGSTYLEKAVAVLERQPEVGIVYCGVELFGEASGEWALPAFSLPHQLLDNQIFSAAVYRRETWRHVGGYSDRMRHGWEDWDFWLCVLGEGKIPFQLDETLFYYRIRRGSRERSIGLLMKAYLMSRLFFAHRRLYLEYAGELLCILRGADRRRPAAIKMTR